MVFITEMKSIYSAVRTRSLNKTVCASSLKVLLSYAYVLKGKWLFKTWKKATRTRRQVGVAQSAQMVRLRAGLPRKRGSIPGRSKKFSCFWKCLSKTRIKPTSYLMAIKDSFPGGKKAGEWPLISNEVLGIRMSRDIPPLPICLYAMHWENLLFLKTQELSLHKLNTLFQ